MAVEQGGLLTCDSCKEPGKKFTMFPSKSRKEFMVQLCPKCSTLRKFEDAKPKEKK